MQSNHIKPEVNYREFRIHKLNTPEFSHVRLLLYWPIFGLLFLFLERLQPLRWFILFSSMYLHFGV